MVSYTKARAEGLGLECKTGLLVRPERVVILAIGLLTGTVFWALALLAVFSHVTATERIVHIWRITRQAFRTSEARSSSDVLANLPATSTDNRHLPTTIGMSEARESSARPLPTGVPPFTGGVQQE